MRIAALSGLDALYRPLVEALTQMHKAAAITGYKRGLLAQDIAAAIVGAVAELDAGCDFDDLLLPATGPKSAPLLVKQVADAIFRNAKRSAPMSPHEAPGSAVWRGWCMPQPADAALHDALRIALATGLRRVHGASQQRFLTSLRSKLTVAHLPGAEVAERLAQFEHLNCKVRAAGSGLLALRIGAGAENAPSDFGAMCASRIAAATGCAFHHAGGAIALEQDFDALLKLSGALDEQMKALLNLGCRLSWRAPGKDANHATGAAAERFLPALSLLAVQAAGHHASIFAAAMQPGLDGALCLTTMSQYLFRNFHLLAEAHQALTSMLNGTSAAGPRATVQHLHGKPEGVTVRRSRQRPCLDGVNGLAGSVLSLVP